MQSTISSAQQSFHFTGVSICLHCHNHVYYSLIDCILRDLFQTRVLYFYSKPVKVLVVNAGYCVLVWCFFFPGIVCLMFSHSGSWY
jgi:hypothetical protein